MQTISVIIPTFNRADRLVAALESVFAQTQPPKEVLVIDDGSTDSTQALVQSQFPQVHLHHQDNRGVSAARNLGLIHASGDWIAFLDSDDQWHPEKLQLQMEALAKEPELRISHTNERWIRNGNFVNAMDKHRKAGGDLFEPSLPICFISPSSVLMHRSLLEQYGQFDESLPVCEDYDLWLRIGCREKFQYLKQPLVTKFGGHEDQLSRRFWGMDRFRIQSLVKLLQQSPLSATQRLQAIQVLLQKAETYLQGVRKRNRHDELEQYQQLIAPFRAEWRSLQSESQSTGWGGC